MKMQTAVLLLLAGVGTVYARPGTGGVVSERPGHEFVFVCRDGGAGGYEAFPDVCRLADGRLMAGFYAGSVHVSLPPAQCTSMEMVSRT